MTITERSQPLTRLGYTEREGAFVCLVALNGGFFLRRQFCTFAKSGDGGTATAFIEKLIRNEHGRMVTGFGNLHVYHVFARPVYNAIGEENNRNRRERAAVAMKNRLMSLDFVLDLPLRSYLSTEQEKVSHFTGLGIKISDLPVKEFRTPGATSGTPRYFIDKYPMYVPAKAEGASHAAFTFIDEGLVTSLRFESWLHQYERLFARLNGFDVVYVAALGRPFAAAEKAVQAFVSGGGRGNLGDLLRRADLKRLVDYLAREHLYETGQFDSFGVAELNKLRRDRDEFSGSFYKALYGRWKALGDADFQAVLASSRPVIDGSRARFSTCLLEHNYDVFGN